MRDAPWRFSSFPDTDPDLAEKRLAKMNQDKLSARCQAFFSRLFAAIADTALQIAGWQINMKLRSETVRSASYIAIHPVTRFRRSIPSGWYMIEASTDRKNIGCLLEIRAYRQSGSSITDQRIESGSQSLQPGTNRTTKKIILIERLCDTLDIYSANPSVSFESINFQLKKLTNRFARQRLTRALTGLGVSYPCQAKTTELYTLYKGCYPAPGIHETYQFQASQYNKTNLPLSLSEARALLAESITILTTDDGNALHLSEPVATPLILLTDSSAQLNRSELDKLKNAAYETDRYQLWYSDHDYRDADSAAVYPCYKPAWNPGLLKHGNYVGAVVLCQTSLFIRSGGIHPLAGQSIIYEFLLRCCSLLSRNQIKHIPFMLYHLPSSHYQHPHGFFIQTDDRLALERDVQRTSATQDVVENGPFPGTFTIRRHLRGNFPSVNVIIPTKNNRRLLESCVSSVMSITDYPDFSITIVDNGSTDSAVAEYLAELNEEPCISKIDYSNDFNFSAINNLAVSESEAEVVVLLNDDIEVTQIDWLRRMVAEAIQPDVACVGTKLIYANGLVQHAGVVAGMQGVAGHVNRFATQEDRGYAGSLAFSADYSAVTAACLAVRRRVYLELDGLDETHLAVAYNDVDFCLRALEAGYRNRLLADVQHIHHESVSRGHATDRIQRQRFHSEIAYMKKRHAAVIEQDPAWNPNFSKCCSTPFVPSHAGLDQESGR